MNSDENQIRSLSRENTSLRRRLAACCANYGKAVEIAAGVLVTQRGRNGKKKDRALEAVERLITEAGTLGADALAKAEKEYRG